MYRELNRGSLNRPASQPRRPRLKKRGRNTLRPGDHAQDEYHAERHKQSSAAGSGRTSARTVSATSA